MTILGSPTLLIYWDHGSKFKRIGSNPPVFRVARRAGGLCTVQNMPKMTTFGDKNDAFWNEVWFREEAEACVAAKESERGPPRGVARRASERSGLNLERPRRPLAPIFVKSNSN